ncbi:uncharacterized protein TEOVI_000549000 [Trypanosoma equiperdum]|uniref:Uncharacterized protein n=1 Tax=Trypanosoma equiperdum TaxID=5694 RepID=A0A1G4I1H4_TRYEQ|nr:hypothetical protein, conserved [Trypanosoma equiperdum]
MQRDRRGDSTMGFKHESARLLRQQQCRADRSKDQHKQTLFNGETHTNLRLGRQRRQRQLREPRQHASTDNADRRCCKARYMQRQTSSDSTAKDLEQLTILDLKSKPDLLTAPRKLNGGSKLENDALEAAIKTYFGSSVEQFKTTFITKVNNKHSKHRKGEQLTDGTLSEQTSGAAYTSTLAHIRQE